MADRIAPSTWLWLVLAFATLVFANWAWRSTPDSMLVASTLARTSAVLSLPDGKETRAWRVDLDFSRHRVAVAWLLHEGGQPGLGYELRWRPDQLALELSRAGEPPQILGTAILDHSPRELTVVRRGLRLRIDVEGRPVLAVLDLLPTPPLQAMGFQAAADLAGAQLTLYNEHKLLRGVALDEAESRGQTAVALARLACTAQATSDSAQTMQQTARVALRELPADHSEAVAIDAWLAWNRLRLALARPAAADSDLVAAAGALIERAQPPAAAAELPGLIIEAMSRAITRALVRPTRAVPPRQVIDTRARMLRTVETLGYTALDREGARSGGLASSERQGWTLRLVVHAASCLAGEVAQPTPAEGPAWAAERWRAFAGGLPRLGRLPEVTGGWHEAEPLTLALDLLMASAGFDPLSAVVLCATVNEAARSDDAVAAEMALGSAPAEARRHAVLARALLALRGIGSAEVNDASTDISEARAALATDIDPGDGEAVALAASDPLAFALDRLLASGLRRGGTVAVLPGTGALPPSLAWAAPLLAGTPNTPIEIWRLTPERPREGLAAALIMQELAGLAPDWSLLAEWPGFTVPLALLIPLPGAALPVDPPQMPVAPIVP